MDETPEEPPDDGVEVLEIEDHIDLHGFRPRDIPDVVESYLTAARAKGFLEVRLIHGRGTGVQRARVQSRLRRLPFIVDFNDAPTFLGGWGATVVRLLPPDEDDTAVGLVPPDEAV